MNICIIGNSKRTEILKNNLIRSNYTIASYRSCDELPAKIDAQIIILPIPTVNLNGKLNLGGSFTLTVEELLDRTLNTSTVITCGYSVKGFNTVDLNTRDDFAYLNAIPTAEGAISIAISECDISLFYAKTIIFGFGRIGKILANRLHAMGCDVTVAARSLKDLSYAKSLGFSAIKISEVQKLIINYDLIFQTVPSPVITADIIDNIKKTATVIELSSKSVGTNTEYAAHNGIKVISAMGLPEKTSPTTAGYILTESIGNILHELNGGNI